ncbi:MAG TPA: glycosyltransferase [Candidatus Acidoferrales bacterium]|nr:glycosyltransferase [Candidatus Acidoferrales bacterium]
MNESLDIVIFGLAVTSSWGNGHATTYRALMRGLDARGHTVTFLERNLPWYAHNRDLPRSPYGRVHTYSNLRKMKERFRKLVAAADLVIVGSYVPDGSEIGEWVTRTSKGLTAFYDIDTPVTLAALERGHCNYISPSLIGRYDLYLSFTGGPTLRQVERRFGARNARPLYCSVDPGIYATESCPTRWDLGYIGTYSEDRQPWLDRFMLAPARESATVRMVVAGAQYPPEIDWPRNVKRIVHLSPRGHRRFYNAQRFTLNLTRDEMRRAGYSPSVRLFEAAACGTAIISDSWPGLDTFLRPGKEILITRSGRDTLEYLTDLPEKNRIAIGLNARARILSEHTAVHRAIELESYVLASRGVSSEQADTRPTRTIGAESVVAAGQQGG